MRATVLRPRDLGSGDLRSWSALLAGDPSLDTPFLCPELAVASEAAGRPVRVAVLEDEGPVGYFPYELGRHGVATPVAGPISDRQGVVAARATYREPRDVLRACSVRSWRFTAAPGWQVPDAANAYGPHTSPVIDLSRGLDSYLGERRREHHAAAARKLRKLERERGSVRFVAAIRDPATLSTLERWKSGQYSRLGTLDRFAVPWVADLVRRLHGTETATFAGMLSGLYAGDELVAAHFGMRSAGTWHYWFPAYDPAHAAYSPGLILLLEMARAAPAMGMTRIDLGPGDEPYKRHLMSDVVPVVHGRVDVPSPVSAAWALGRRARGRILRLPGIGPAARSAIRRGRKARAGLPQGWR